MSEIFFLTEKSSDFPPLSLLESDDLAVIGSNLNPQTLLAAYRRGYFPWYNEGQPRCWFHPNPRMVLFPDELHVSKSMKPVLRSRRFHFKMNTNFVGVIESCRNTDRGYGENLSWITDEIIKSYTELFDLGVAQCAEAWRDGRLVGGLYGLKIGRVFFGESMFSLESNASKFAFINFVRVLQDEGVELIDCQQETAHMASLGARPISRKEFGSLLRELIPGNENIW